MARTGATVWASNHEADGIEAKAPARGGNTNRAAAADRRFVPGESLPLQGGIETVDTHGQVGVIEPEDALNVGWWCVTEGVASVAMQ